MSQHSNSNNIWTGALLAGSLLTLLCQVVVADSSWQKETESSDGISVYSRSTPNTNIKQVRAVITINAPPEVVLNAASAPETYRETTKKYVEKNIFNHTGKNNTWYNYQLVNYPFIDKRDYCLRYDKYINPEKGIFRLTWQTSNQNAPPPSESVIRVTNIKGQIDISPDKDGNSSTLRYTILADPGGSIPTWIINLANRKSLPDILRQIRDASEKISKK
ncbi:MAG: hypothetical protein JXR91_04390 [Deltaproteobacteria bacterium]|nr:hypothetical protein [Deltaproteobacteria bacterium]